MSSPKNKFFFKKVNMLSEFSMIFGAVLNINYHLATKTTNLVSHPQVHTTYMRTQLLLIQSLIIQNYTYIHLKKKKKKKIKLKGKRKRKKLFIIEVTFGVN